MRPGPVDGTLEAGPGRTASGGDMHLLRAAPRRLLAAAGALLLGTAG